jgi:uracil-DNA glycosylase family 4
VTAGFTSPVRPGSGWPGDPATPDTPVAHTGDEVRDLAATVPGLADLEARVSVCRACPRLVAWREQVATTKRRSFADEPYWGRPMPGWGDDEPEILVVGLAPAAHGGNRTGRIFTGDRSGDWLFAALHRAGLAAIPTSTAADDGQRLIRTRMVAAVRCAPPANAPAPDERDRCAPWLVREIALALPSTRAVVVLGLFAWQSALRALAELGYAAPRPRPKFTHGAEAALSRDGRSVVLIGSFHPSQQNTFTGKLTEPMLDAVFTRALAVASAGTRGGDHGVQ